MVGWINRVRWMVEFPDGWLAGWMDDEWMTPEKRQRIP
jgi:hypothetical protein